jgi:cyclase
LKSPRLIPVLSLIGNKAVKTKAFKNPVYVGDPVNTVSLFSSFEVDELIVLDISRYFDSTPTSDETLERIIASAYMPIAFGGGISDFSNAKTKFAIGFDKVLLRSNFLDSDLPREIAKKYGTQAVTGCLDISYSTQNHERIDVNGSAVEKANVGNLIKKIARSDIGELIVHDKDQEGSRSGFRSNWLYKELLDSLNIPIVPLGGCSDLSNAANFVTKNGFHSVAASSMFLFRPTRDAVLINYPETEDWLNLLEGEGIE